MYMTLYYTDDKVYAYLYPLLYNRHAYSEQYVYPLADLTITHSSVYSFNTILHWSYIDNDVEISQVGVLSVNELPDSLLLFQLFLCQVVFDLGIDR